MKFDIGRKFSQLGEWERSHNEFDVLVICLDFLQVSFSDCVVGIAKRDYESRGTMSAPVFARTFAPYDIFAYLLG